jgi:uncharacterized protein (TIGR02466 family)
MDNQQENKPWGGNSELIHKKMAAIFPTHVLGYDDPKAEENISTILEFIDKEKWTPPPHQPSQTINNKLHKCPELQNFFKWVHLVLEDYRRTFKYEAEEIKVNLAWCNKSDSEGAHQQHVHPNSFISGIYYLSENSSPTCFEDPRYQTRSGLWVAGHTELTWKEWHCPSERGTLVLFPSWLPHFTTQDPNIPAGDFRFTLSFNTLPYGVTNAGSLTEMEI